MSFRFYVEYYLFCLFRGFCYCFGVIGRDKVFLGVNGVGVKRLFVSI